MNLDFRLFEMPLKHPFTISRYTVNVQKTIVARISDGEISGYGEATVNPYYHSTVEKLSASVQKVTPIVAALPEDLHPAAFWDVIAPRLQDDYFALCAIDIAYWDYFARKQRRTLRSFFTGTEQRPMTSYTIGIDDIETMKAKILEMPWPIYKIKLGRGNDMAIVETLRKITDSLFRVDANAAWTAAQAIGYSRILKDLNVEFIEQPLPAADTDGMKRVKEASVLPVIADESCQRLEDVAACKPLFHGINIKLMKCGGITPALKMIGEARSADLSIMAGCMTESSVGISALSQLAPLLDYLDADGALLLAGDIADGVTFREGKIRWAEGCGSGAEMHRF
ncbi:Dipeptide epimerase [Flavobacterium longum]|uniref:dipeptide epimerase n=1 Tax=Flavobacterium longum TaxID=1299340 RepID=UPI0039EC03F9